MKIARSALGLKPRKTPIKPSVDPKLAAQANASALEAHRARARTVLPNGDAR